jgi:hypothetical protein
MLQLLSKPNLENKQQNILNLCLLLTHIIVRRVYLVLDILRPTYVYIRTCHSNPGNMQNGHCTFFYHQTKFIYLLMCNVW